MSSLVQIILRFERASRVLHVFNRPHVHPICQQTHRNLAGSRVGTEMTLQPLNSTCRHTAVDALAGHASNTTSKQLPPHHLLIFPKTPPTSSNNNNELCFLDYKALSYTRQLFILTKTHPQAGGGWRGASDSGVPQLVFSPLPCSSSVVQTEKFALSFGLVPGEASVPHNEFSCPQVTLWMTYLCTRRKEKMKSCF